MLLAMSAPTLRDHCLSILESGTLKEKLAPMPEGLSDAEPGAPVFVDHPVRSPELAFSEETRRLPRPGELSDPAARALCLARFAHHELMAVELFAWALLRWPELEPSLRHGFARVIEEEQLHCRLYLGRLEAHGAALSEHELSPYFWRQAPVIAESPHGAAAFLAGMGLTLEQANLDFTLTYRDAFRSAGDEASAQVSQRVHDDEIGHVRLAAQWLRRLRPEADDTGRYESCVPFPLAANRAKGKRFDVPARRSAGLDDDFIEHIRGARSAQQLGHPETRDS